MTDPEMQSEIDTCMALIPGEDDVPWIMEQAAGEDAVEAVVFALECRRNGTPEDAAWAAWHAYGALDHYVINHENIDPNEPGGEDRVLGHALVQAELGRQRRDIDELLAAGDEDVRQVAARFRERAAAEAAIFFGVVS
jgi:hypothetical protein